MSHRGMGGQVVAAVILVCASGFRAAAPGAEPEILNPYAKVDWQRVELLHSFSHEHGTDPQVFRDMGFGHLPLSNYYPSKPVYPLPAAFVKKCPEALGAPNAEQHSTTDNGLHFCSLGSYYTVGYGKTPSIKANESPIEYTFSGLNVFDPRTSPWLGIYRLDVLMAGQKGSEKEPEVRVTIDGALQIDRKSRDFALAGDGIVRERTLTAKSSESMYLKTTSDAMRVRLEFDAASTRITRFRLMQGTNRPWRDAFRATLDGTLKDAAGKPIEGLLFPDGGGITINHPRCSLESVLELLDFDPRVLGIEVWNQHTGFGGPEMGYYQLWDKALRAGRRCFGFFVKDHVFFGRGRNVLLVSHTANASREEREHEALLAYREGRFFGMLGALAADASGKIVPPYDKSDFRFTRIAVKEDASRNPAGVEVAVAGADPAKRPNTLIRFVTDAGVAQSSNGPQAYFAFPRDAAGAIRCRYVRVEAFAYPNTHLGGQPLTAEALAAMNVHDISRIHDRMGPFAMNKLEPGGQSAIPVVDMLFSQPILVNAGRASR